jgi:WD40 repeat protein
MKHSRTPLFVAVLIALLAGGVLWALPLERPRAVLPATPLEILEAVQFSPDSSRVLRSTFPQIQPFPGGVDLWDAATGTRLVRIDGSPGRPGNVVFSPDSRLVASVRGGDIRVWDAGTGEPRASHARHPAADTRPPWLTFTPTGRLLVAAGSGKEMLEDPALRKLRDAATGEDVFDLRPAFGDVTWMSNDPLTGCVLAGDGKVVRVVRLATGERVAELGLANSQFSGVLTPDARRVVGVETLYPAGPFTQHIFGSGRVFDVKAGTTRSMPSLDGAISFAITADGRWLAARFPTVRSWLADLHDAFATPYSVIDVFDLDDDRRVARIPHGVLAAFAPDGRTLAVGLDDGSVQLWDFPLRKPWGITLGGAVAAGVLAFLVARRPGRRAEKPA